MNAHDENRMRELIKQAVPPITAGAELQRDLWPTVLRRLDTDAPSAMNTSPVRFMQWPVPWFDWALVGGLVVFAVTFPATIPVFLYYL